MPRLLPILMLSLLLGCSPSCEESSRRGGEHPVDPLSHQVAPIAVAPNLGDQIPAGFRGGVHPCFHGQVALDVTADWTPIPRGMGYELGYFPEPFRAPFESLRVAARRRSSDARTWSGFLPEQFESAGQIWSLDKSKILALLKQFDPRMSLNLIATGRRAGPDGAFGILKSISPSHAEIAFRIHLELHLEPGVYCTPAYLAGRLRINRDAGVVEYFEAKLPTDRALNTTLTVVLPAEALIDIVRVERMELRGGAEASDEVRWTSAIDDDEAARRLRSAFYKFADIQWLPLEQAETAARESDKPIFAVVLWGALDDQSC